MNISLFFVVLIFLFITYKKYFSVVILIKLLIIWFFVYRIIVGSLIIFGVPIVLIKDLNLIEDAILISMFIKTFRLKNVINDKINILLFILIIIASFYLIINSVDIKTKLMLYRIYLYIFISYNIGYSSKISNNSFEKLIKLYIYIVLVMSVWSIFTCYIIGYDKFFMLFPYAQSYGLIKADGIDAFYRIQYKLISLPGINKYRLHDFNGFNLHFGNYVAIAVCFSYYLLQKGKIRKIVFIFLLSTLFISLARAATISAVVFLLFVNRKKISQTILIFCILLLLFIYLLPDKYMDAYIDKYSKVTTGNWSEAHKWGEGHSYGWYSLFDSIVKKPLGYGYGHTSSARTNFDLDTEGGTSMVTHGIVLSDLGIFGLLLFISIFYKLFKMGFNKYIYNKFGVILIGMVITYNLIGFTKPAMFSSNMIFIYFLTFGIIVRLLKYEVIICEKSSNHTI